MKLCRFHLPNDPTIRHGLVEGEVVKTLREDFLTGVTPSGPSHTLSSVRLVAPVASSKVVGVGLNYRAHAKEMNKPLPEAPRIFIKPSTSIIGPRDVIRRPPSSQRVDHEAESGVVIGKRAKDLNPENAMSCVLGYTCVNDVTARDLQIADVQFTRGKGFDTFCPMGPWIETELNPNALNVTGRVNGQVRQSGNTSDMVYSVVELLVFITGVMTLLPGDVIATGTPSGVGQLMSGDKMEVEIEGVGALLNVVE